jgi:hypothetical protein
VSAVNEKGILNASTLWSIQSSLIGALGITQVVGEKKNEKQNSFHLGELILASLWPSKYQSFMAEDFAPYVRILL